MSIIAMLVVAMWWQDHSSPASMAPKTQDVQAAVAVLPEADPPAKPSRVKASTTPVSVRKPPPTPAAPIPPYVEIGAMVSRPGEQKEAFLVRLAQTMDLFTRTTGHETCGMLMQSDTGDAYKVRLTSNRAHISCTMMSFREPGFHPVGEDIHSHPRIVGGVASNGPDIRSRSDLRCGRRIIIYDETFSDVDFRNGPGYLVSRGRLLHQHGAQWPMRQVATFEAIEESEPLQVGGAEASRNEALAAAAWSNEEVDGLPSTLCPEPTAQDASPQAVATTEVKAPPVGPR